MLSGGNPDESIKLRVKRELCGFIAKGWRYEGELRNGKLDVYLLSPEGVRWDNEKIKLGFSNGNDPRHKDAFRLYSTLYWDLGGREFVNIPEGFYALDNPP